MSGLISKIWSSGDKREKGGSKLPPFKLSISLEQRRKMSAKMRADHPDRIPIILHRSENPASNTPDVKKTRLLIPGNLTVGEVLMRIRQEFLVDSKAGGNVASASQQQAIFLFVGKGVLPPVSQTVQHIYSRFADEDGFLYITYSAENTFGASEVVVKYF